jgi:hypothetical protein
MNEQLLKFIELCLMDGEISEKEKEVIFRKSKELGVPEDECEIILEGMIIKRGLYLNDKKSEKQEAKKIFVQPVSVFSIDKSIIEQIGNILIELNSGIKKIVDNPELVNKIFIDWLKDMKINMKQRPPRLGESGFYHIKYYEYGQSSKGEIFNFVPSKINFYGKNIIGQFSSKSDTKYLLTTDSFVQFTEVPVKSFFNTSIKLEFQEEQSIDSIDIFKDKYEDIFYFFLREFFQQENELQLENIVNKYNLTYDDQEINQLLEQIQYHSEVSTVYKVNVEIKKVVQNLNDYLKIMGRPFKEGVFVFRNEFTPFSVPKNLKPFGPNEMFFNQVNLLELKIKFLTGVISLRNDFVYSIIEDDLRRIDYLKIKLDQLGLLMNYYESNSLSKLDIIIGVLNDGFNSLHDVISDVLFKLSKLDEINDNIKNVEESVRFGNLLNVIQTFQMYRINQNTKGFHNKNIPPFKNH